MFINYIKSSANRRRSYFSMLSKTGKLSKALVPTEENFHENSFSKNYSTCHMRIN